MQMWEGWAHTDLLGRVAGYARTLDELRHAQNKSQLGCDTAAREQAGVLRSSGRIRPGHRPEPAQVHVGECVRRVCCTCESSRRACRWSCVRAVSERSSSARRASSSVRCRWAARAALHATCDVTKIGRAASPDAKASLARVCVCQAIMDMLLRALGQGVGGRRGGGTLLLRLLAWLGRR